jgi:hypothetical protein
MDHFEREELRIEKGELRAEGDIAYELHLIREALQDIAAALKGGSNSATGFTFKNTGDNMATNFTVVPGQPFQLTATANGSVQTGNVPVWTCDDPSVSFTPDSTGYIVNGATSASDTAVSFKMTLTGINSLGATISSSQVMTFGPGGGGGGAATGYTFVQNS